MSLPKAHANALLPTVPDRSSSEPFLVSVLECFGRFFGCCCLFASCGACCYPYKSVSRGTRGVITRFGKVTGVVEEGLHYVNPITENINIGCTKLTVHQLVNQDVLTKDNLPISVDGAVFYCIKDNNEDFVKALYGIQDITLAVSELALSTLRLVFAKHTLQECLEKRREFAEEIMMLLEQQTENWGVHVSDIKIIDIKISQRIQELLATAATATREGDAQIIAARASVEAARLMREAADQRGCLAGLRALHKVQNGIECNQELEWQ